MKSPQQADAAAPAASAATAAAAAATTTASACSTHWQIWCSSGSALTVQVSAGFIVQLDKAALNKEVKALAARQAPLLGHCFACKGHQTQLDSGLRWLMLLFAASSDALYSAHMCCADATAPAATDAAALVRSAHAASHQQLPLTICLGAGACARCLTDGDCFAMHQPKQLINSQMHQPVSICCAPRLPASAALKCACLP